MTVKILYIIDSYKNPYAGTEGQLYKLLEGVSDSYTTQLSVFKESEFLQTNELPFNVRILNINKLVSLRSWWYLLIFLIEKRKEGFRIAHIYFNDASLICPLFLKVLGYRVIISRRDMGYWYTSLIRKVLRFNRHFVDRVIVNSEAVKTATIDAEGYKADDIDVIYNGYPLDEVENVKIISSPIPAVDGGSGQINVVLVANLRPIKRIDDAIRAMQLVITKDQSVKLFIVGDGQQQELNQLVQKLSLKHRVELLGPRTDIEAILSFCHIGILCSESEGFSNTLIEYMSSSLPVICTAVGGNVEIVEHGKSGFLYPVGDIDALAGFISQLANDASLRSRMGDIGRKKVVKDYGLKQYIDAHKAIYSKLS